MAHSVFVYRAALYCEKCGSAIRKRLQATGQASVDPDDESSYDSDDYPKGPYGNGGGEADCPQHCDSCGVFLENDLTSHGYDYVREAMAEYKATGHGAVVQDWADFYEVDWSEIA